MSGDDWNVWTGKQLKRWWKKEMARRAPSFTEPLKVWARKLCPADFERWMGRKRAW